MLDLIVTNVRTHYDETLFNLGVENKNIKFMSSGWEPSKEVIDGNGGIILPPFIEMHNHADTFKVGERYEQNHKGTIEEGIKIWDKVKKELDEKSLEKQMSEMINTFIANGVFHARVMIDVSAPELRALFVLTKLKKSYEQFINLEIVAFPQLGLNEEWKRTNMEEALKFGADYASAVPHLENSEKEEKESINYCFRTAEKLKKGVHIFCDENDDQNSVSIQKVLECKKRYERIPVTVSHLNALNYYSKEVSEMILDSLKELNINVVSCPLVNSVTIGKKERAMPVGRGITRVKEMFAKDINICTAHDDIKTPFYPYGNGNMLQAAYVMAHLAQLTTVKELAKLIDSITYHGANAMGIEGYGLIKNMRADFLLFSQKNVYDLLTAHSRPEMIYKDGMEISGQLPSLQRY